MSSKELKELNARTKANRERSAELERIRKEQEEQREIAKFEEYSMYGCFFALGVFVTTVLTMIIF